jgi:hypothetical protein
MSIDGKYRSQIIVASLDVFLSLKAYTGLRLAITNIGMSEQHPLVQPFRC